MFIKFETVNILIHCCNYGSHYIIRPNNEADRTELKPFFKYQCPECKRLHTIGYSVIESDNEKAIN